MTVWRGVCLLLRSTGRRRTHAGPVTLTPPRPPCSPWPGRPTHAAYADGLWRRPVTAAYNPCGVPARPNSMTLSDSIVGVLLLFFFSPRRMAGHFKRACELEYMFWDAASTLQAWPCFDHQ